MTPQKFDLNALPPLKIIVANSEESKKAQIAFFKFGYGWLNGGKTARNTEYRYLYANSEEFGIIEWGKTQKGFDTDESTEITLPELEALAAEKQGSNIQKSLAELRGVEDETSWGEFEPGELERARRESQARYDAAREYMAKFPNGSAPLVGGHVDKALHIAAGLEQTPPNTDTTK